MATNVEKRNEKTRQLMATMKGGDEPVLEEGDGYRISFTKALVWYNNNEDDKNRRKWLSTYLTQNNQKALVPLFNEMPDWDVRQLGVLCRLKTRGQILEETEELWMKSKFEELIAKHSTKKKKVVVDNAPTTPTVSIQQRMEEKAHELAGEIEGAIDDFVINKKSDFSAKSFLAGNQVGAPIAKRIGELFVRTSKELHEAIAGDDPQLVEGYSNFTKKELKKFAEFVDQIIADCNQQVQTAKANRMPRKRKEKPASVQVAKMKVMKEFPELGLKSALLTNIIGSTEVWFYNTKYRRIGVYKGAHGGTLAVKGTTIIGFDTVESKQFTLRKPEEFFKGLTMGKRPLNASLKTLKTKPAVPNGRFNEETILLGAF
jgi:hypothetical protein